MLPKLIQCDLQTQCDLNQKLNRIVNKTIQAHSDILREEERTQNSQGDHKKGENLLLQIPRLMINYNNLNSISNHCTVYFKLTNFICQ